MDNTTFTNTIQEYPRPKPKPAGKGIGLVVLLVCLGCITLGAGLGVGYAVMQHFLPDGAMTGPAANNNVTTLRLNPAAIPINPQDPSFADIIPQVKDAVVSISVTNLSSRSFGGRVSPGAGSGFIFYEDGDYVFIATNNHVIESAHEISISLDDSHNIAATAVGTDRYSDLAVLAVSKAELLGKGIPFTVADFGDSDALRMGDSVVAIGNSMGEGQIVTKGIISATDLQITVSEPGMRTALTLDVMQTDAAVNRGNSGGPLVNQHGEVVGVVTAKLFGADIEGMGYALPINSAADILAQLKETGSVSQPWIGISHLIIEDYMREMFNLPSSGLLIREVVPNSPAEEAGLMPNDLIAHFGTRSIASMEDLRAALAAYKPGDTVVLGVYRSGERREFVRDDIELTLGSVMP